MKFNVTLKPNKVTAKTKNDLISLINKDHVWTVNKFITGYLPYKSSGNYIRVYNIEKHRKKVSRYVEKGKSCSKVLSPNHWLGYYYDIPLDLIRTMKLKLVQDNRNFYIQS